MESLSLLKASESGSECPSGIAVISWSGKEGGFHQVKALAARCEPFLEPADLFQTEGNLRHSGEDLPHLRESVSHRNADRRLGDDGHSPAVRAVGLEVRAFRIQGTEARIPVRALVTGKRAFRIPVTDLSPE